MKTTEPQGHGAVAERDIYEITGAIIGAAIAVHRALGPGPLVHLLLINFNSAVLKDGLIRRAL